MEIGEERVEGVTVLRPVGRIDNDTSLEFHARVIAGLGAGQATLVDFSAVEFVSSAGLAVLAAAAKHAKATNRRIAVAALRPIVEEIFAISRFARVVSVYGTAVEGVAALA